MLSSFEEVIAPCQPEWSRSVYHLYVIRVQDREGLQKYLAEAHIHTGIHYPVAFICSKLTRTSDTSKGISLFLKRRPRNSLIADVSPTRASDQTRVIQTILEFLSQSANLRESTEALSLRPV